jgi:putative transposon-encoded protein
MRMIQKTKSIAEPFGPDGKVAVPRRYVGPDGTV